MKNSEIILGRAKDAGKVKERDSYLSLAPKNEQGVPTPNGPHTIIVLNDKITKTNEGVDQMTYTVSEGGKEKLWNVKLWNIDQNTGEKTLHYLVQALAEYNEGDKLIVQMKKNSSKNFVDVKKVGHEDDIPTIQLNEELEDGLPSLSGEPIATEEIDPTSIPF